MRILSKRQLKELVLYSPQHVARPESAGAFPKRVQLGQCRVGWIEQEVLDWLQEAYIAENNYKTAPDDGALGRSGCSAHFFEGIGLGIRMAIPYR